MPTVGRLSDKDRLEMNKILKELDTFAKDIQQALDAGLEQVTPIADRCVGCVESIKAMKAAYFPTKP